MCKRYVQLLTLFVLVVSVSLFAGNHIPQAQALNNGVALTPPIGWNSWNHYGCSITEAIVKQQADAMVSNGMKAAGYQYINLDDCWQASSRDSNGNVVADPTRFPDGMKALANYVHNDGLKFGLYSDAGTATCSGFPGFEGHEQQDATTYASWGIDYIKIDWCNTSGLDPQTQYTKIRNAFASTGRSIVLSLCNWGGNEPWLWGPRTGNIWRTTGDISDNWSSMLSNLDSSSSHASSAGPGGWNDPDMLEIGNGGMSTTEYQAQFSMWSIMAAPLLAGNDLTTMSATTASILTNTEVIAVDQDAAGIQGTKVTDNGSGLQVWSKKLAGSGQRAVVLFNRSSATANMTVNWSDIGLTGSASVRDLWAHQNLGSFSNSFTASVQAHGVVMLNIVGTEGPTAYYEAESPWNTMTGNAIPVDCSGCSGGTEVGNIDSSSSLQFNNVAVSSSGSGTLAIYFVNGGTDRIANMSVNGGTATSLTFHGMNDNNWGGNVQTLVVPVNLKSGNNTILFSSSTTGSPDFDRIMINSTGTTSTPTPVPTVTPTPIPTVTPTPIPTVTPTPTPTATSTPTATPTPTASGVHVTYQVGNQWPGGFTANLTITNTGSTAINGWKLQFTFPGTQQITQLWNGVATQTGNQVTVTNQSYNGTIAPGQTISLGFNGSWSGSNSNPTSFTVNGIQAS